MISCEDSDDPQCMALASQLLQEAERIHRLVTKTSNSLSLVDFEEGLSPVEALAQLTDYAYRIFGNDSQGMIWGMTKVLVGIDPSDYYFITLQPMNWWIRDTLHIETVIDEAKHERQYFFGEDWLPYRSADPTKSEIGDWDPRYLDGTANQAYHFWFSVASAYYDPDILTISANLYHDPFYLEKWCGDDLEKWRDNPSWFLKSWAKNANKTSVEDFALANKGLRMGQYLSDPFTRGFQPGDWIRSNLKAREFRN